MRPLFFISINLMYENMNDFSLTIIIPILNEENLIHSSLQFLTNSISLSHIEKKNVNIIFCDGGSSDDSIELLIDLQKKFEFKIRQKKFNSPSVGKTLNLAKNLPTGKYVLFLPIDCHISSECFNQLTHHLSREKFISGGFFKEYEKDNFIYNIYSSLQNLIRSRLLRNLVWTNGIWINSQLFHEGIIPEVGFLEDVILSDKLKKYPNLILKERIIVSPRKYEKTFLKRIWINLLVMISFRFKLKSIEQLKKIYLKK
ncbi:glycosyltransferase [Bacteriovoracaceae bacterium]|nr:glycosyltransferase [Bacteriovoracaceae bacterium]